MADRCGKYRERSGISASDHRSVAAELCQCSKRIFTTSYYDGMLYYNTPRAVWRWNFDPESEPEKVFELDQSIPGEIWDAEAANGRFITRQAFMKKERDRRGNMCLTKITGKQSIRSQ